MFGFTPTRVEGAYIIEPQTYSDKRGCFFESYNERDFNELGIDARFVQDNQSFSAHGVLRGLHYQTLPQAKLVRVARGAVFDVAVDLRKTSPTYLQYACAVLSAENRRQLYIPPFCAHGFLVLSDCADFLYKCTDFYRPEHEAGIRYDDPSIGIKWPFEPQVIAQKDLLLPLLDTAV